MLREVSTSKPAVVGYAGSSSKGPVVTTRGPELPASVARPRLMPYSIPPCARLWVAPNLQGVIGSILRRRVRISFGSHVHCSLCLYLGAVMCWLSIFNAAWCIMLYTLGGAKEQEQAKQQAVRAVEQPRTPSNVGEDFKSSANSRLKEHGRAYRWHPWGKSGHTAIGIRAGPQHGGHPLGKRASQTAGGLGVPSTSPTLGVPGERGHKMTRCARHLNSQ